MSGYFWYSKQNLIGTLCFAKSASNLEQNLVRDSLFVKEPIIFFFIKYKHLVQYFLHLTSLKCC